MTQKLIKDYQNLDLDLSHLLVEKKEWKPKDVQARVVQLKAARWDNCRAHKRGSREPTGVKSALSSVP